MSDIVAKFSAQAEQLMGQIGRVEQRFASMQRKTKAQTVETAKGSEDWLKSLQGIDRQFGQITHAGRAFLGVLGVGGGAVGLISGGIAMAARHMEHLEQVSRRTGEAVIKAGAGIAPGVSGGLAASRVQELALQFGVSPTEVAKKLATVQAKGVTGDAALTQVRSEMVRERGGAGWEGRRAAAEAATPAVGFAGQAQRLEALGEARLVAPVTSAQAKAQGVAATERLERRARAQAAQAIGRYDVAPMGEEELGGAYNPFSGAEATAFELQRQAARVRAGLPGAAEDLRAKRRILREYETQGGRAPLLVEESLQEASRALQDAAAADARAKRTTR